MLGIVLINYNSEEELIRYIVNELSKLKYSNVIVIVNNSYSKVSNIKLTGGLNNTERKLGKDVFIITKKENLGYARANNFGAEFLSSKFDIEYLLFSNTDVEIKEEDIIEILINKLLELEDVAAIGPRVIRIDGVDQSPQLKISFIRYILWNLFPSLQGRFKILRKRGVSKNISLFEDYAYWVSGCFILMKKSDFFLVNGFDSNTFLYGEEKILAERLLRINKKMYFFPKVAITHFENGEIKFNYQRNEIMDFLLQSDCYYYENYIKIPALIVKLFSYTIKKIRHF